MSRKSKQPSEIKVISEFACGTIIVGSLKEHNIVIPESTGFYEVYVQALQELHRKKLLQQRGLM